MPSDGSDHPIPRCLGEPQDVAPEPDAAGLQTETDEVIDLSMKRVDVDLSVVVVWSRQDGDDPVETLQAAVPVMPPPARRPS